METFVKDLRLAIRMLAKRPGFTAVAVSRWLSASRAWIHKSPRNQGLRCRIAEQKILSAGQTARINFHNPRLVGKQGVIGACQPPK